MDGGYVPVVVGFACEEAVGKGAVGVGAGMKAYFLAK